MRVVLDAKIDIPGIPSEFIDRVSLRSELAAIRGIGLLCAPAGYGKTSLLAAWARASIDADTAWVSLDRDDNDPRLLWSAVLAAVVRCPSVPSSSRLQAPWEWPEDGQPELIADLVGALEALPGRLRLVLDDVQELAAPETLAGVRMLLRNRPRNVTVLLSGRVDPPLGLQRLRLSHPLQEFRADRLRFSRIESDAMLRSAGLDLTSDQVDVLHERTGGWPAGLRLAALAVSDTPDRAGFLAAFSGDDRLVADYLVEEVFSNLSTDTLEFLRDSSVSDPLPTELAAELSGREEAGSILDALEHRTGMISVTGRARHTYRLQPLIRSYLQADLRRHGFGRTGRLHGMASRWWANHDRPVTALDHAVSSRDPSLLSDMLHRFGITMLLNGEHRPLLGALDAGPAPAGTDEPWQAALAAFAHQQAGDPLAARVDARRVDGSWPADPPDDLVVLRDAAQDLGALPRGERVPTGPVDDDLPAAPELEALARSARGAAQLRDGGDTVSSRAELDAALALANQHGFDYLAVQCLALRGLAAGAAGDLRAMQDASDETVVRANRRGWQDSVWAVAGTAMLAFAALLRADPAEAERWSAAGLERCSDTAPPALLFGLHAVQGAAVGDAGEAYRGLSMLQHARAELRDRAVDHRAVAAAAILESAAGLRLGHQAAARAVQSWMIERAGDTAETVVMHSWAETAVGRHCHARRAIRRVTDGETMALLPHTLVEAWLQEAALALLADERAVARRALQAALAVAEPLGALRPFVEAGPGVRALLAQQFGRAESSSTFAGQALAAARPTAGVFSAVLSQREHTVLTMLPSLLSLEEIAADLTVSINTVKSHVRSIYAKLGVSSRRTAVLAAYEQGLITTASSA